MNEKETEDVRELERLTVRIERNVRISTINVIVFIVAALVYAWTGGGLHLLPQLRLP